MKGSNGGRLLIRFLLCERGVLREPLLYLSLFLKTHRRDYYDLLQRVREQGDWESWIAFFLRGVRDTATQAAETARRILALFTADRAKIEALGRGAASALRVHLMLQSKPMLSIPEAAKRLDLTQPTVTKALGNLSRVGIVKEITGRRRGRIFTHDAYLMILSEGTEPLAR